MKKIRVLTSREFDLIREHDLVEPEQVYQVSNPYGDTDFGWSPDGDGMYWYFSLAELDAEHGVTL